MSDDVVQVWVRTDKGQVYGPLTPTTVELLIDNAIITGRVQVSLDGNHYVFPGRMPGIRMVFPRTLWGEQVLPPTELDEVWAQVVVPPPLPPPGGAAPAKAGVPGPPVAGPGARPPSGPTAGPGARAQAAQANQARPAAAQRPQPVAAPPIRSSASVAAAMGPSPVMSTPSQVQAAPAPRESSPPTVAGSMPLGRLPAQGALAEVSCRRLYFLAAAQDVSGLLTVQLSDRSILIHFRKGSPDSVESSHPDDALHTFLIRQKLVSMDQLAQAQKEGARFGGELLPALFGLGLLNPNVAIEALTQRVGSLLAHALHARDGQFTFQASELPPHKAMPPGNRWQVYAEQLRKLPVGELGHRLVDALDLPVMRSSGQVPVADLRLSAQETRVYALFDGTRTLNQLLQGGGPEGELALRVAYMLSPCDLVSFAGTVVKAVASVTPTPAPVAPVVSRGSGVMAPAPAEVPQSVVAPPVMVPAPAPPTSPVAPPVMASAAPRVSAPPVTAASVPRPPGAPAPPLVTAASVPRPPGAPAPIASVPRPPGAPGGPADASAGSVVPGPPVARNTVPGPAARAPSFPGAPPGARPPPVVGPPVVAAAPGARPPMSSTSGVMARPVTTAPTSSPSGISARPATPGDFAAEAQRLQAVLETMKSQNHYEVLGLSKDAAGAAVKQAYFKAAKDYHPDTVPPGAPESLSKAKADIFARIGEAHRTLSDDKLRVDYLAEVEAGTAGEKVDVSKILRAEELFQKSKILVQARKYAEAVKLLDECVTLTPEDAELYTWRGYARFFTFADKKVGLPEAMKDVTNCLKRNPNVVAAHFHQGMMNKVLGDLASAKKHFQQTVKLDPKHIDAQRELRMMK